MILKMKVAIIGWGWVGHAMQDLFPAAFVYSHNIIYHDGTLMRVQSEALWKEKTKEYKKIVNACDVAFICLPTPCPHGKRLDTSQVQKAIRWCNAKLIVVRSTVNPGDCYRWSMMFKKNIVFQPEYLGETPEHPLLDTV